MKRGARNIGGVWGKCSLRFDLAQVQGRGSAAGTAVAAADCGVRGRPVGLWLGVDQVRLGGVVEAALGAFDGVGERVGRLGEAGAMAEENALGL